MNSHLVVGKVRHRRSRPTDYELEHDVWYAALDLDELDEVTKRVPLIRRNRRGVVTFRDADHLPAPAVDLPAEIRAHLRAEGIDPGEGPLVLVTNLRTFGYVFNPASFYLCHGIAGELRALVVEVHNTFGERHLYTLTAAPSSGPFTAAMDKAFYVSPFIGMNGRYRVTIRDEADRLVIGIREDDRDGMLLSTSLVLRRRPLTSGNLVRLLLRYPLVSHKTMAMIHWHALRLWLRGVPFLRHGQATSADQPGPPPLRRPHGAAREAIR